MEANNMAATRKALENLTRFTEVDIRGLENLAKYAIDHSMYGGGVLRAVAGAIREGKKALSEPARNCDLYKNKKDAEAAFISEECKHPCGNCTVNDEYGCALVHECGVDWLFATAERKGERR